MNLYPMKDFSLIIYYLGLNVMRDKKTRIIYFTQTAAIDRIFKKIKITECLSYITPIKSDLQLKKVQNSSQILDYKIYIQRIGKLLYLTTNTRLDIT
jgi:hypothetical protein